ncbi:MAG: hypothetical protein AB1650_01595 [Candidatus Omnitrophota bacterium]
MPDGKDSQPAAMPVLKILNQIRTGEINLEEAPLPKDIRLECVEHLWITEAQPVATIAGILNVSEKTIRRDQDEIRERNQARLSPEESLKLVSELMTKFNSTHENLMRLARGKEGSVQEKAQSGYYAYKAIEGQIEILQKLGYAPNKPMTIEADIYHHQEEDMTVDQLKAELAEIEKLAESKGRKDPEIIRLIETAKHQIALAEAKDTLVDLRNNLSQNPESSGEQGK